MNRTAHHVHLPSRCLVPAELSKGVLWVKAAFVTRLRPCRLPGRAARQLPDQSTTLWVESSSTSDPRLRGALPRADIYRRDRQHIAWLSAPLGPDAKLVR